MKSHFLSNFTHAAYNCMLQIKLPNFPFQHQITQLGTRLVNSRSGQTSLSSIYIYISAVLSRGWAKASACCFQVCLPCAILCQVVSFQYSSKSSLHHFAGLPRNLFLPYVLQLVMRFVHLSSLSRLMCPAQDHFIVLVVFITSVTPVFALTQAFVFLSWYVILSILLSIFVCAAASFF